MTDLMIEIGWKNKVLQDLRAGAAGLSERAETFTRKGLHSATRPILPEPCKVT